MGAGKIKTKIRKGEAMRNYRGAAQMAIVEVGDLSIATAAKRRHRVQRQMAKICGNTQQLSGSAKRPPTLRGPRVLRRQRRVEVGWRCGARKSTPVHSVENQNANWQKTK